MNRYLCGRVFGVATVIMALGALATPARADSVPPPNNINLGTLVSVFNTSNGLSEPAPYGSIYVNYESSTQALITVIADPTFLIGGQNALGINTSFTGTISDVRFSGDSPAPPDTIITSSGSGSGPASSGTFAYNFSFNDGHDAAVSEMQFTFTLSSGSFVSGHEGTFLLLNSSGNDAYAHIFPVDITQSTGFAFETALGTCPNGQCNQTGVPEPASLLLLGSGLGFVGRQFRRKVRRA